MNHAVSMAMAKAGMTSEKLADEIGVDPKTVQRWANPGCIPQSRHRAKVAALLGHDVLELWPDILRRRDPAWLREWVEGEREALALRWFELAWVPGLLQTEGYARATLRDEVLSAAETDRLVAARISRQVVFRRDPAPMLTAVLDESILHRAPGNDRVLMAEQITHIAECALLPFVQVQIVPADTGMYPGLGGPFIIADLPDGLRAAHVDSQVRAQIIDQASDIASLERRWERIQGYALPRAHSLDLIRKAAASWT